MLSLTSFRCPFRLIRRCFLGKWIPRKQRRINDNNSWYCAWNWPSTQLPNGRCTKQNLSQRMKHKIFRNFEIQANHVILASSPELVITNKKKKKKKNLPSSGFCRSSGLLNENHRKRKERLVLGPCLRTKKATEHEGDGDTNCHWQTWNVLQKIGQWAGRTGNRRRNRDDSNYSVVKIYQNTEKSPGDLRRFAIPSIPGKYHQIMLVEKICPE